MSNQNDPRRSPPSFAPVVERFAREKRMTLRRPSEHTPEEEMWGAPLYQLGFVNSSGQLCFLYVDESDSHQLRVWVQRWALDSPSAGKQWDLSDGADAAALVAVLEQAYQFADV